MLQGEFDEGADNAGDCSHLTRSISSSAPMLVSSYPGQRGLFPDSTSRHGKCEMNAWNRQTLARTRVQTR